MVSRACQFSESSSSLFGAMAAPKRTDKLAFRIRARSQRLRFADDGVATIPRYTQVPLRAIPRQEGKPFTLRVHTARRDLNRLAGAEPLTTKEWRQTDARHRPPRDHGRS